MIPFQFVWCPIVLISGICFLMYKEQNEYKINQYFKLIFPVFILIFTEAYGKQIKMSKYYYCVTFFVYEWICFTSIFVCVYALANTPYIGKCIENLRNAPLFGVVFFWYIFAISSFIMVGFICLSHWAKNTIVHISLCRHKLFEVRIEAM